MSSPRIATVLALGLIAAVIGGFAILVEQNNVQHAQTRHTVTQFDTRISDLETTLEVLLEDNEELAKRLVEEKERRELLAQQQETLLADVDEQFATLVSKEATAIVHRWSPFVYQIDCVFENDEDGSGSAIVEQHNQKRQFITNRHVLEEETLAPTACTLTKPGGSDLETTIPGDMISFGADDDDDIGYGVVTDTIPAVNKNKRCSTKPAIGDRILILGYPGIGATDSITATEGIVSGFDDEYYITSAKIEKGNSGSAAIHIERDCLLGLPTRVVPGKLESLARILPLTP